MNRNYIVEKMDEAKKEKVYMPIAEYKKILRKNNDKKSLEEFKIKELLFDISQQIGAARLVNWGGRII
jgi:hypothetical protein